MKTTRRTFLKQTIGTSIGMGALSGFAIGQAGQSANNRVNLAFIGVGGHGHVGLNNCKNENLIAFCDVDDQRAAKSYKEHPHVSRYRDYRKMFDKLDNSIDAVVIATPNHTHFPIAMEAMQRGKHIYLQKPLAHTIWETRTLQQAANQAGIIHQMGN